MALARPLARRAVTRVLIGSSRLHQLEDNLRAVSVTLSAAELALLYAAKLPAAVYANGFIENLRRQAVGAALGGA